MAEALYTIDILRLAASTAQWPPLAAPDGSAERRSPTCGSRVGVDVTRDASGSIAAIGVTVSACALGQASAAILASAAPGRDVAAIRTAQAGLAAYLRGEDDRLPDWPNIDTLAAARSYPARHASILLAFDAALAALEAAATDSQDQDRAHG
ncbi:iron-sulfur cluster assembly scaffold protein [Sphingobium sufflavum]|uniref:iron-sulfur cluster assembly scaffold protein n=1 Tax=Sphingobium sufflavum TaxID=1129547 RepID=UPI001F322CD0|nr:iron-sulfur cluster assembly scaffold protein [Sphingobium sufflavum]MCE7797629.1 iron-sulfur cluster assembly scaffold protein [Sphingobium sufflavum]